MDVDLVEPTKPGDVEPTQPMASLAATGGRVMDVMNESLEVLGPIDRMVMGAKLVPLSEAVEGLGLTGLAPHLFFASVKADDEIQKGTLLNKDEAAAIHLYTQEWDVHENSLYHRCYK